MSQGVDMSRIFTMSFASVYPLYLAKVEKKGRTTAELDQVIRRLGSEQLQVLPVEVHPVKVTVIRIAAFPSGAAPL